MIRGFADHGTEDLHNGIDSKAARRICPESLVGIARRKLDMLNAAERLASLRVPPGNRLEALKGERKGQHSIRLNDQYRICFQWKEGNAYEVEILDYH